MWLWGLLVIGLWAAGLGAWWMLSRVFRQAEADKVKQRLAGTARTSTAKGKGTAEGPALFSRDDPHTGKLILKLMSRFSLQTRLQAMLEQAGLKWRVPRLVHASLALFLSGFSAAWVLLPGPFAWLGLAAGALLGSLPLLWVSSKRSARLTKFEGQFPEGLEFVSRSMRAGHAFSVALEMLHKEFQEPLAAEFRRTFEEHNLGMPLDTALLKLSARIPSLDVHFFVSAVLLQKRTGGNLAEILDKLAYTIRERFKLRGKIKAISAHGKVTGSALTMIPCGVAALLCFVSDGYIGFFLNDEMGRLMALAAVALQVMGFMVIQKIVNIEV